MTTSRSYIDEYVEPRPHGRAVLQRDVVIDGELVAELSGTVGSPAPVDTVRRHERFVDLDPQRRRPA